MSEVTEIHTSDVSIEVVDAYPLENFKDMFSPTTDELNRLNLDCPNVGGWRWVCGLMDNYESTVSIKTDSEKHACDAQEVEREKGWEYGFTATIRIDKNMKSHSANTLISQQTWKPDRVFILAQRLRYKADQFSPYRLGDWVRMGLFTTDITNYHIANDEFVSIAFKPFASGSTWDVDLMVGNEPAAGFTINPGYEEAYEFVANENVDWFIAPDGAITNFEAPDINEINALINVVNIVNFPDVTFPHATESDSVSQPKINQSASSSRRGTGKFEASGQIPYPQEMLLNGTTEQVQLANMLRQTGAPLVCLTRIAQSAQTNREPVCAGDKVSVFAVRTTKPVVPRPDNDSSYLITTDLSPNGRAVVDAIAIDGATPTENIALKSATLSVEVGKSACIQASLYGHNISWASDYKMTGAGSANATVSNMGIVTGVKAGSATVEVSHPSGISATVTVTVSAAVAAATGASSLTVPGSSLDGGVIAITGFNRADNVTSVTIDGTPIKWFGVGSDNTKLLVLAPEKTAGTYDIVISDTAKVTYTKSVVYA